MEAEGALGRAAVVEGTTGEGLTVPKELKGGGRHVDTGKRRVCKGPVSAGWLS